MQKTEQKTEQQAGLGMSFCEEEGRITVFRKTLEALEWPSHYRFLYNRKMKQIAVQACGAEESGAHRVGKPDESNSGEIKCIMKGCVNEYSDCTVDDIVEKYIEGTPEVGSVGVHVDDTNRPKKSTDVIKGSNNEDSTLTEGTLFYDVRFDAIAPKSADSAEQEEVIRLIINVEAQTKFKPGYPLTKRAIYYCSRMISAQHGPIFTKSEYGKIRKVYSIWICTQPSDGFENTLTRYSIKP